MSDRTRAFDFYMALGIRLGYSPSAFHHTSNAKTLAREAAFEAGLPEPDGPTRQITIDSVLRADELLAEIAGKAAKDWRRA
jgi:hypothetical protein